MPSAIEENAGPYAGISNANLDISSNSLINSQEVFQLASQHAFSVIDGAHLMSEEGIEL